MRLRISAFLAIISLLLMLACYHNLNNETRVVKVDKISFDDQRYSVVYINLNKTTISLHWQQPNGKHFRNIQKLDQWLQNQHQRLLVATNAGIFDPEYTPVGLHIEQGKVLHELNLKDGQGNFFLKPNGVFLIDDQGAKIVESSTMTNSIEKIKLATQSGPLLVLNNIINEKFAFDSTNRLIRSGVGVKSPHEIYLAISDLPVNFFDFALLFRERLGCANALYLDGVISKLYSPVDKRFDDGEFTGILAVQQLDNK